MESVDLDALLAKWRWLVPSDVDVRIRWADCDGDYAESHSIMESGKMFITIAHHDFNPPLFHAMGVTRDVEADVIHELLHWRAEGYKPKKTGSTEHRLWEWSVERTAQDFLRLDRGNNALS